MTAGPAARLILAPHLWPRPPLNRIDPADSPVFYLSWPGWEEFLRRRLGFRPDPTGPTPLFLPAACGPERSRAALDQLADQAAIPGAGLLALSPPPLESPTALAAAIRRPGPAGPPPAPPLSDQAYLALWSLAEFQAAAGEALLAETARQERAMWAALRGEEAEISARTFDRPPAEPDHRTIYAWRCWWRLAGSLLQPGDLILPTAPEPVRPEP